MLATPLGNGRHRFTIHGNVEEDEIEIALDDGNVINIDSTLNKVDITHVAMSELVLTDLMMYTSNA